MGEGFENGASVFQPLAVVRHVELLACAITNDGHEGFRLIRVRAAVRREISQLFSISDCTR